jgi:regulator of protease activity HflC (stomatin/prohibitin superfamily)
MTAERVRRAVVTEAEGTRESSITVAEGSRQATILAAEGDRQAAILEAEGARQASILRAEGFAEALNTIYGVAQNVDQKTMNLQYFEALKSLGEGESSKLIFPMEFTKFLGPIGAIFGANGSDDDDD